VHFESGACVWQTTGEDWTDVALVFSTERASLGAEPPELDEEVLAVRKVGSTVSVQARQDRVHTAGLGGGAPEVPGIDDGGETRKLRAPLPATVPSDGRPHRVTVLEFNAPATLERVCVPELVGAVILRTELQNAGHHALLAGPVDLVRDSGRVGRTSVHFVAPGERFELGWGPDPDLRVHRTEEEVEEDCGKLSSWSAAATRVDLRLSNLGPEARTVMLTERIPVSEVEKVRIQVVEDKTTAGRSGPDADGFLRWEVALEPFGHRDLALKWVLRKHDDVQGV